MVSDEVMYKTDLMESLFKTKWKLSHGTNRHNLLITSPLVTPSPQSGSSNSTEAVVELLSSIETTTSDPAKLILQSPRINTRGIDVKQA